MAIWGWALLQRHDREPPQWHKVLAARNSRPRYIECLLACYPTPIEDTGVHVEPSEPTHDIGGWAVCATCRRDERD